MAGDVNLEQLQAMQVGRVEFGPSASAPFSAFRETMALTTAEFLALRKDAERYRWLRDAGSTTWTPFRQQWKMDAALCDAAVDAEIAKQAGIRAA